MTDIKDRILADAKSRKAQYADRIEVLGPQTEDLPEGLHFYNIRIVGLFDYIPINYIVLNDDVFTSLERGDFLKLLRRLRVIEDGNLSAQHFMELFLLIEYPTRHQNPV